MEYTRVEMVLIRRGWLQGAAVAGPVAGPAHRVAVDSSFTVMRTWIPRRQSRKVPAATTGAATSARSSAAGAESVFTSTTHVRGNHTVLGTVSRLWVSRATGKVTDVLVRPSTGMLGGHMEYIVPVDLLTVSAAELVATIDAATLKTLPTYRPDAAIGVDVQQALEAALADPRARRAVKVRVDDGHVNLSGVLDTIEQVHYAERAVAGIAGVRGYTVDLVAEETVAAAVEARIAPLAVAKANGHGGVRVLSEHGIVHLEGSVVSAASRNEIERAAITVAGVRAVVNNLRVQGEPPGRGPGTGPLVRNR